MAIDTMQAVSDAEKLAEQTIRDAKAESEQLVSGAVKESNELLKNALLNAKSESKSTLEKAAEKAELIKSSALGDLQAEIDALKTTADSKLSEASVLIKNAVLRA